MKIGIVSGYFNPLHRGHIEYINASKDRCDYLIVIVNNDLQVNLKKSKVFMDAIHRQFIMEHIKAVDLVIVSIDTDLSVSNTLRQIRYNYINDELIFFNSGDRTIVTKNTNESNVCDSLNIREMFISLPKVYSSSELLAFS